MTVLEYVYRVELCCLQCGREMGLVELARESDAVPFARLNTCCQVCGGQPIRSEYSERVRTNRPEEVLTDPGPQRGRPPKWLVALRKEKVAAWQ